MNLFKCQFCQNPLHFDNTICTNCQHRVGYLEDQFEMSALEPDGRAWRALAQPKRSYILCANAEYDVCNWLIDAANGRAFCESCRHNHIIPDLTIPANRERWRKIELAKRYVFRSLMRWGLPMPDRSEDPQHGLVFDFKGDARKADGTVEKVLTGHDEGVIALNISEADDGEREPIARSVVVVCEELVSVGSIDPSHVLIPGAIVDAVAVVPRGAHPTAVYDRYDFDRAHLEAYVKLSRDGAEAHDTYIEKYIRGVGTHQEYLDLVESDR